MTGLFPPAPQVLRPYQSQARDALRAAIARLLQLDKPPRVLLVAPTGSGKTTVAASIIAGAVQLDGDVLFLAHRKELIDQCSQRLDGVGVDHGIIQANHPRSQPWARVQVASVQTLTRRLDDLPRATLIIVDEAHHARAATYSHILDRYKDVAVVGLTATPWRLDNRGLGELFQDLVVAARPRELIAQGHLVPYTGFAYDMPDLGRVHQVGADYKNDELGKVMSGGKIAGNIVGQWLQHSPGKRTIVFAVNIAHSMNLVERFRAAGVAAEHVDGTTPAPEREGVLRRFASGETTVVCNVAILGEGYDLPAIETVVLARPTLSLVVYLQQVGRGMRPSPGKTALRIHDHAGCLLRHGLPDADRNYSLETDGRKGAPVDAGETLRRCMGCFALYDGSLTSCPQCGRAHVPKPRVVREDHNAEAIPIEQLVARANERQRYLELQVSIAEATGKKRGWAAYRYKERFGEWPSKDFWAATRRLSDVRLQELKDRVAQQLGGGAK